MMRKDSSRKGGEGTNRNGRKACKTKVTCREEEKWARDNSNVKADEKQEMAETLELGSRPTKKQRENVKAEIIEEEKVKREALGEEKGSNRVGKEAKA